MILSVNIDHTATIRNARGGRDPDPIMAATIAILAGADGITLHLREDRRHVNDRDLRLLREIVANELNLEMAATEEMTSIALAAKPDLVTIVPEKRLELTTEGGMDLSTNTEYLTESLKRLQGQGILVSVFINPDIKDVEKSHHMGFDMVEIHTGFYADSKGKVRDREFLKISEAIRAGNDLGLLVNAGHGLNYSNVFDIASISQIRGLYIGHSIVSRAILLGMESAVRDMKRLINEASRGLK